MAEILALTEHLPSLIRRTAYEKRATGDLGSFSLRILGFHVCYVMHDVSGSFVDPVELYEAREVPAQHGYCKSASRRAGAPDAHALPCNLRHARKYRLRTPDRALENAIPAESVVVAGISDANGSLSFTVSACISTSRPRQSVSPRYIT
jgi:hypothetical protein